MYESKTTAIAFLLSFLFLSDVCCWGQEKPSTDRWMSDAQNIFWESFPTAYRIGNTRFVRDVNFGKVKSAAAIAKPKMKREMLNILASQEIANQSRNSERLAKLFRSEFADIRLKIFESVLLNDNPWSSAIDIAGSVGKSDAIRQAWQSKKEAYQAKLTATRLAQRSLLNIVGEMKNQAPGRKHAITAKLEAGDECIQLRVKSSADLSQPIVILKATKKQTENWAKLNGGGALFGSLFGLTKPEAVQDAVELAEAEQEFWNQKIVIGLMLDKLPAGKSCAIEFPVLNFRMHQIDSMEVEIISDHGSVTKSLDVEKVLAKIKKRKAQGDYYAWNSFTRRHSLPRGEVSLSSKIYPGAIWSGIAKSQNGKRLVGLKSIYLVIDSVNVSTGEFTGVAKIEMLQKKVTGKLSGRKLSIAGLSVFSGQDKFQGRISGKSYKGECSFEPARNAPAKRKRTPAKSGKHLLTLDFLEPRRSSREIIKTVYLSPRPAKAEVKDKSLGFQSWAINTKKRISGVSYVNRDGPGFGRVVAEFSDYRAPDVLLRKKDGSIVRVPIESFTLFDQKLLKKEYGLEFELKSEKNKPFGAGGIF